MPAEPRSSAAARIPAVGLLLGPALAAGAFLLLPSGPGGLSPEARGVAALAVLMAAWWVTEAIPIPATALLPLAALPIAAGVPIRDVAAPYADPVIFLFMGGFMLALAMERCGLHRRIALRTMLLVGTRPRRLVAGVMLATAVLSMWISNTATAVMMIPIGLSVVALGVDRLRQSGSPLSPREERRLQLCVLLGIGYAASVGGLATLIGTPPNAQVRAFMLREHGVEIGFLDWMALGVPLAAVFLVATWAMLVFLLFPIRIKDLPGGRAALREDLDRLGPASRAEITVLVIFLCTAAAWVCREPVARVGWVQQNLPWLSRVDDSVVAMLCAVALFVVPTGRGERVLDWDSAVRLPWGVLLLFGGGLSLATAMTSTGLSPWIGAQAGGLGGLPTPVLLLGIAAIVVILSELASNTAVTIMLLPIVSGLAKGLGLDPLLLVVVTGLAASSGFMLPAATPPNAIVFGTGKVHVYEMARAGALLDVIGVALCVLAVYTLGPWALGIVL